LKTWMGGNVDVGGQRGGQHDRQRGWVGGVGKIEGIGNMEDWKNWKNWMNWMNWMNWGWIGVRRLLIILQGQTSHRDMKYQRRMRGTAAGFMAKGKVVVLEMAVAGLGCDCRDGCAFVRSVVRRHPYDVM
jgi:hypothetical protein